MDSTTPIRSGLEPLVSIEELAEYLDVPVRTLYDWRLAGRGPCACTSGDRAGTSSATSRSGCGRTASRSRDGQPRAVQ